MNGRAQFKPLSALCRFQRGLTYKKSDEVNASSTAVLRANNIDALTGELNFEDIRYISDSVAVPPEMRVRKDSVVICTASGSRSHLGKAAYIGGDYDYAFGGFMGQITPSDNLSGRYLHYLLQTQVYRDFIGALSASMSINNLKYSDLSQFQVPLCPRNHQERIVAILNKAFEGIAAIKANTKQNIRAAHRLFDSQVNFALRSSRQGWQRQELESLCDIKHGFAFKGEFFADQGEYVLLTPGSFHERGGYRDRGDKQKFYNGEIPQDFVLSPGDLLVAMTEQAAGLLGSPLLVPETGQFLHNQRLGLVTPKAGVAWANEFFFWIFNTPEFRSAVHSSASGVKVRHTSPTKIGKVVVSYPTSLAAQREVACHIDQCHGRFIELRNLYNQKLAALEALKQSLLHQAFSGNL